MEAPSPFGRRRGMRAFRLKTPLPTPLLEGEGISIVKLTQI